MSKKTQNRPKDPQQEEEVALGSAAGAAPPPGTEDVKFEDRKESEGPLADLAKSGISDEEMRKIAAHMSIEPRDVKREIELQLTEGDY